MRHYKCGEVVHADYLIYTQPAVLLLESEYGMPNYVTPENHPFVIQLDSGDAYYCGTTGMKSELLCQTGFELRSRESTRNQRVTEYTVLRHGCRCDRAYKIYALTKKGCPFYVALLTHDRTAYNIDIRQKASGKIFANFTAAYPAKELHGFGRRKIHSFCTPVDGPIETGVCKMCSDGVFRATVQNQNHTTLDLLTIRHGKNFKQVCDVQPPGYLKVTDLDVSPDGRLLLLAAEAPEWSMLSGERCVQLYRIVSDTSVLLLETYDIRGSFVAFAPDGLTFAVGVTSRKTGSPYAIVGVTIMDVDV